MREISSGIIIYRQTKKGLKFLLLYHGNRYWNFPKGKLESEEKSFKAALREVKEETGLNRNNLFFKDWFKVRDNYFYTRNKEKIFKIVTYYLAESKQKDIKISDEHEGYAWFLYKEAEKTLIHKNLKRILEMAYDLITKKRQPANKTYEERHREKSLSGGHKNTHRQSRHL